MSNVALALHYGSFHPVLLLPPALTVFLLPAKEYHMTAICKEARNFVSACEAIHSLLEKKLKLTVDERELIEYAAIDLLSKVKPA